MRREFKICGQIGEKGQEDRLSHRNLMHDIDRGLSKGHSEAEIMKAVTTVFIVARLDTFEEDVEDQGG